MRILSIVPCDVNSEAGRMPDPALMAEMSRLGEESARRGVLLTQDGLQPTSKGSRVTFKAGKVAVTDGPFAEAKELIGGFAILKVKDLEDGIAEARKLPLRCEVELRPLMEQQGDWIPLRPNKRRFMLLYKAGVETGRPPSPEWVDAICRFNNDMIAAEVLVAGEGLLPSAAGARVDLGTGEIKRGPFDPTNLLTGYWMIQAADKAEAVEWAKRAPIVDGTIEVRPLFEMADFAQMREGVA